MSNLNNHTTGSPPNAQQAANTIPHSASSTIMNHFKNLVNVRKTVGDEAVLEVPGVTWVITLSIPIFATSKFRSLVP